MSKYEDAIKLVMSQTNYSEEETKEKLKEWDGNYLYVIKEYLNPQFLKKKKVKKTSTNQKMMREIRNFMDTANKEYLIRKEKEEREKMKLAKIRQQFLENKKKYPECLFDPPNCFNCVVTCKNPLCPKEKDARELINSQKNKNL